MGNPVLDKYPCFKPQWCPTHCPPHFSPSVVWARYQGLRVQEPASDRLCPHASWPRDGTSMRDPIFPMSLLAVFTVPFFSSAGKLLVTTLSAGMRHILGPDSHVSLAPLVTVLPAMVMEIWHRQCRLFGPIFPVFATLGQHGNTISPWGKGPGRERRRILIADDQQSKALSSSFCSSRIPGYMQLTVRTFVAVSRPVSLPSPPGTAANHFE